jgi:DNA-binding transcriptional regulator YiaG
MEDEKRCPECGGALEMRGYRHVEHVGHTKVTDGTGMALQCKECGEPMLSLLALAGYERRAASLVLRDGKHVDGAVVRYARKALGLRQTELAALLQCTPETLSRWENSALQMKRAEQLALVALIEGVERDGVDIKKMLSNKSEDRQSTVVELEVRQPLKTAV